MGVGEAAVPAAAALVQAAGSVPGAENVGKPERGSPGVRSAADQPFPAPAQRRPRPARFPTAAPQAAEWALVSGDRGPPPASAARAPRASQPENPLLGPLLPKPGEALPEDPLSGSPAPVESEVEGG